MTAKKSRIQLDLPPKAYTTLQRIRDETEAPSYSEVFRTAMKLYERLLTAQANGLKMGVLDPGDNTFSEIIL